MNDIIDIIDKLDEAQDLLVDVYYWMQENDLDVHGMSVADTCIWQTLEIVKEYYDTRSQSKETD